MAGDNDRPRVGLKSRGIGNKGLEDRSIRDTPAPDESALAQAIVDLRDKYRADIEGLIQLGNRLQKEFQAAGKKLPLVRRTAAKELLRVYRVLQGFESASPRGPGGILMQHTPFGKTP